MNPKLFLMIIISSLIFTVFSYWMFTQIEGARDTTESFLSFGGCEGAAYDCFVSDFDSNTCDKCDSECADYGSEITYLCKRGQSVAVKDRISK